MLYPQFNLYRQSHALSDFWDFCFDGDTAEAVLSVPAAAVWSPVAPNLYELVVEVLEADKVLDFYHIPIGIRTVEVAGDKFF